VWLLATLILWLFSHGWPGSVSWNGYSDLSFYDVYSVLFFHLLLLLLGFAVAYWIRMPVAGLLVLFPVFGMVVGVLAFLMEQVLLVKPGLASPAAFMLGIFFLLSVGVIQHALARRRFTRPDSTRSLFAQESHVDSSYYRPPAIGKVSKPSPVVSLLWQQVRQTAPACLFIICMSLLLMFLFVVTYHRPARSGVHVTVIGGLIHLFVTLSASWLGVLTFYGDNRHRRHAFFADRGISPTQVWWTRMVPTSLTLFVLASVVLAFGSFFSLGSSVAGARDVTMLSLIAVLFAFGQLISQGIERPVLALFAAPAYAAICLMPILYCFDGLPSVLTWILILPTVPVLLFASWQLSGRWLEGRNDAGYYIQILGYTMIAIALPCLIYGGGALVSTYLEHL